MSDNTVKVWDPFVRFFHWTLVAAFFIAYVTEDDLLGVHVWAGYWITGLLLMRLVWGFIGSRYARFSDFVHRPGEVMQYLKEELAGRARRYLGHNPAGGAMIIMLLVSLGMTVLSGLVVYGGEECAGPLAGWLCSGDKWMGEAGEEVHEFFANFTLVLVGVHVLGVVLASRLHGENLVAAMWHGRKASDRT
jgi:cytochrome b